MLPSTLVDGRANRLLAGFGRRREPESVQRAREVLEALAKDKVGKAALREKVQSIQLSVADNKGITVTGTTLELNTGRRPVDWYTRKELEEAVQSAL